MLKAFLISFACAVCSVATCTKIDAMPTIIESNSILLAQTQMQSTKPFNVGRLFRTAIGILTTQSHQISSEMTMTGDILGIPFSSKVSIETIVEMPNKFNSKINFISPNALVGKQYQVVSNGKKFWIYNLKTKQYSVSTHQEFERSESTLMLGIISNIYISMSELFDDSDLTQFLDDTSDEDLNSLFAEETVLDEILTIEKKTFDNIQYDAYKFGSKLSDEGFEVLLDERLNKIKYISMQIEDSETNITFQEKIISQVAPLAISPQTFVFSPPDGSEQLNETINIAPFKFINF